MRLLFEKNTIVKFDKISNLEMFQNVDSTDDYLVISDVSENMSKKISVKTLLKILNN
jgi:hypothetical protein